MFCLLNPGLKTVWNFRFVDYQPLAHLSYSFYACWRFVRATRAKCYYVSEYQLTSLYLKDFRSTVALTFAISKLLYLRHCISCCSNDLSLLLLCLDLWSLRSENVSFWGQIFATVGPSGIYKCSKPVWTKYLFWQCQVFVKTSLKLGCFHCMQAHTSSASDITVA